jgi:GTP cyclohydrolase I
MYGKAMKDIQGLRDHRRINIKKVGVKNISYPVSVLDKAQETQKTVATVNMYVNLPHQFKGTHMSRFVEILNRFHGEINLKSLQRILEEMKIRLQAEAAHMEIAFPYFLRKTATRSEAVDLREYRCTMHGSLDTSADLLLEIQVPISPPLPSQVSNGLPRSLGHWGRATIRLRFRHFIWIEDIITLAEEVICHDLCWPQTGQDCGLSVESITKALAGKLQTHADIRWFSILVENLSQGHTTFASLSWPEEMPGT